MNIKLVAFLGGVAAGYFMATTLATKPLLGNAYMFGASLKG